MTSFWNRFEKASGFGGEPSAMVTTRPVSGQLEPPNSRSAACVRLQALSATTVAGPRAIVRVPRAVFGVDVVINRDTIDTLRGDIDRAAGWVTEYETRAVALGPEITELTGERDRAVAQRDATRPGLIDRTREIRSVLNADAALRIDRVERDPPAYLRGLRRDGNDKLWRTTVGAIEQHRAGYDIDTRDALGPRPGYGDMTRADQYRQTCRHRQPAVAFRPPIAPWRRSLSTPQDNTLTDSEAIRTNRRLLSGLRRLCPTCSSRVARASTR